MGVSGSLIVAVLITACPALSAQANAVPIASVSQTEDTTAPLPAYDVVSIKSNHSGSGSRGTSTNNDSYTATNISLKNLLEDAYGIKEDLISGISGPIDSARFDIQAKVVDADPRAKKLTGKQRRAMLLPFLDERFHLKAHTETRTLPVYELIVLEDGPKFKQSADDSKQNGGTSQNNTELTAHGVSMASFASTLTNSVHRTVIDQTALAGLYDLALKWSPDDGSNQGASNRDGSTVLTDSGPSISTAVQEQLGLKLKPAKGPVETLVVDHVEMPSAN
jgi:uncharacterized protein (TIGR03435 family)